MVTCRELTVLCVSVTITKQLTLIWFD